MGGLYPKVQPLILLYATFDKKGTMFNLCIMRARV